MLGLKRSDFVLALDYSNQTLALCFGERSSDLLLTDSSIQVSLSRYFNPQLLSLFYTCAQLLKRFTLNFNLCKFNLRFSPVTSQAKLVNSRSLGIAQLNNLFAKNWCPLQGFVLTTRSSPRFGKQRITNPKFRVTQLIVQSVLFVVALRRVQPAAAVCYS